MKEEVDDEAYEPLDDNDDWVECEKCKKWYHVYCAKIEWGDSDLTDEEWTCCS